ncbi:hypothetical protein KRX51_06110 [Corynebacterium sp. TAE3-ERU12]|uniref:hypothetical protein n=1 Tax=Corynebacterium sp. TAE3-ERU12 TaxID=2849491 RepID=UPI001C45BBEE|nr:hypothetical protein [Corynebacterium sp. TAE3-ERU12]MBV7295493.1 hypothetical protein [Corynebacterium sp. TAE3-ERU12]
MKTPRNWRAIAVVLILMASVLVVLSAKSFFPGWSTIAWVGALLCFAGSFLAINEARKE